MSQIVYHPFFNNPYNSRKYENKNVILGMQKSISVVIPNYNGKELMAQNLPQVQTALKKIDDFEIIIPDDASGDDSIEFLRKNYPEIILIQNEENQGFSSNINSGIKVAQKQLVLLLNNDSRLTPDYFENLLPLFDKVDTFGVMGKVFGENQLIQDEAKYPGYSFANISGTQNYNSKERTTLFSFFLPGANALVDREKLLELNGFDELFSPYYGEDLDLSLRAWRTGYKSYFVNSSICYHQASSTIKKEPRNKVVKIIKRNKLHFHYVHLDGLELVYFLTLTFLKGILRILTFKTVYIKAFLLFIKRLDKTKASKKALKKLEHPDFNSIKKIQHFILNDIQSSSISRR